MELEPLRGRSHDPQMVCRAKTRHGHGIGMGLGLGIGIHAPTVYFAAMGLRSGSGVIVNPFRRLRLRRIIKINTSMKPMLRDPLLRLNESCVDLPSGHRHIFAEYSLVKGLVVRLKIHGRYSFVDLSFESFSTPVLVMITNNPLSSAASKISVALRHLPVMSWRSPGDL